MIFLFIYNTGIALYKLALLLAFPINKKARQFVNGRVGLMNKIRSDLEKASGERIWFHCASLGEFEQARPVIEAVRKEYPAYVIILTFFSPSGYEIRKNYSQADYIYYLPLDTPSNASRFVSILKPKAALFVKYEFWYHYLNVLQKHKTPTLSFSAIFRQNQVFFKPYASEYKQLLTWFEHIFVQDQLSADLLHIENIKQVSVTGDTRFDRVVEIAAARKEISVAEKFCNQSKTLVIGSSWPEDIAILLPALQNLEGTLKIIIAPHEITESALSSIEKSVSLPIIRFSKAEGKDLSAFSVLLIDNIGMLSSLYGYADLAYVGGAFGKGLHNILEAAVYGIPVIFGPNYGKFREAKELLRVNGAVTVSNKADAERILQKLAGHEGERVKMGENAAMYVKQNTGATVDIMNHLKKILS